MLTKASLFQNKHHLPFVSIDLDMASGCKVLCFSLEQVLKGVVMGVEIEDRVAMRSGFSERVTRW